MNNKQKLTKLLNLCAKHGYNGVAIGMKHESIPQSQTFPFGPQDSIFAKPKGKSDPRIKKWPAIWEIARAVGLKMGCGNSHQCQIDKLPCNPQVWQFKKGRWAKIAE